MQGTHDLGRTPGLVDAQIGDDVRRLEATIARRRVHTAATAAAYNHTTLNRTSYRRCGYARVVKAVAFTICVSRRISAEIVPEKPLPN